MEYVDGNGWACRLYIMIIILYQRYMSEPCQWCFDIPAYISGMPVLHSYIWTVESLVSIHWLWCYCSNALCIMWSFYDCFKVKINLRIMVIKVLMLRSVDQFTRMWLQLKPSVINLWQIIICDRLKIEWGFGYQYIKCENVKAQYSAMSGFFFWSFVTQDFCLENILPAECWPVGAIGTPT